MSIFNFCKKKKHEKSIIGRHEQFLAVNKFLGQDIAEMDWQLAKIKMLQNIMKL